MLEPFLIKLWANPVLHAITLHGAAISDTYLADDIVFVLDVRSDCSNFVPQLKRNKQSVFLCLLGVMRVVIWTRRLKKFLGLRVFTCSAA